MKRNSFFIVLVFMFLQFTGFIYGAIPASERAALIALYNSTNGDNWYSTDGWKTPPLYTDGFAMPGTEGSWKGIRVIDGHVTAIQMWENQLSGTIPSQLGDLIKLTYIDFNSNQLGGAIPSQLGNLAELAYLYMDHNQLSDSIPSQLGNLGKLVDIFLRGNQLSGPIPSQLGNLSNLWSLYLTDNQLSGPIPVQLGNLGNLLHLGLSFNQLSGSIPSQLGNLGNLWDLYLSHNQLSGNIPTNLINLKKVTSIDSLDIGYNCLTATDQNLRAWLNSHDSDWEKTQCLLPELNPPFGSFDTPLDGSTVAGSIAITGWALDDGGLESVKIYLLHGNTQTYIGDALFVEGARPDIPIAYPEYPSNTKAGWGYMMLTNFLPGEGNGTFVLSTIATDMVGKTTELGTKTITVDNAHAIKPFGAIDTPTQGGTATGKSFLNWGWALTPQPNSIPTNGSTINVWVNGVNKGHPTYNNYRQDIASLFPGYANSNGAIGYLYLDTTKYTNGIHTIQWTAADNVGNTDGIGSRYFTIQNTSSDSAQSASAQSMKMTAQQISILPEYSAEPIYFDTGFQGDDECSELLPDEKGTHSLSIKELERVEIQLGQNYTAIQGFLISGNILNPLPIGSTLDVKRGTFSWSPGPGFVGSYSLVFVLTETNGQSFKKAVEIKIEPKFSN